jgi:hypothetical protein
MVHARVRATNVNVAEDLGAGEVMVLEAADA